MTSNRWLEVVIPELDVDAISRIAPGTPELRASKHDRIQVLRSAVDPGRYGVQETMHAVIAVNDASVSANVSRRPRVTHRMFVPHDNSVADGK